MDVFGHQVQVIRIERRWGKSKVLIELNSLVVLGMDNQGSRRDDRFGLQKAFERSRFSAITRSSSSVTVTTLLFECKSIPLYFISTSRLLKKVRKLTLTSPLRRWREAG
jgi:hypothetical protein